MCVHALHPTKNDLHKASTKLRSPTFQAAVRKAARQPRDLTRGGEARDGRRRERSGEAGGPSRVKPRGKRGRREAAWRDGAAPAIVRPCTPGAEA